MAHLKRMGHRVVDLATSAVELGLAIGAEQSEILGHIEDADVAMEARYIVTGFKQLPTKKRFQMWRKPLIEPFVLHL